MGEAEQESVLSLVTELLRRRRVVAITVAIALPVVVTLGLLLSQFKSRARLLIQQDLGATSSLAGLAAQVGLPIGAQGNQNSPVFFAELLRSRDILDSLAYSEFVDTENGGTRRLLDQLDVEEDPDRAKRALGAVEELRGRVSASTDLASGLITVEVKMPNARLAEESLSRLLDIAERLNRRRQQASFAAERQFAEEQLEAATRELRTAEEKMAIFLQKNRTFVGSPTLELEAATLQRDVEIKQAVTLGLAQAFQAAKLEEVRNTPVMTLVESPGGSAEKTLKLKFLLVLGVMLGFVAGCFLAMLGYLRDRLKQTNESAVNTLRGEFSRSIRSPLSRS